MLVKASTEDAEAERCVSRFVLVYMFVDTRFHVWAVRDLVNRAAAGETTQRCFCMTPPGVKRRPHAKRKLIRSVRICSLNVKNFPRDLLGKAIFGLGIVAASASIQVRRAS